MSPFLGVVAFVDVRSEYDNRSEGVAKVLENLGAVVSTLLFAKLLLEMLC